MYKVGDIVRVKKDFWKIQSYMVAIDPMKEMQEREYEVIKEPQTVGKEIFYFLGERGWWFSEKWIEPTQTIYNVSEDELINMVM